MIALEIIFGACLLLALYLATSFGLPSALLHAGKPDEIRSGQSISDQAMQDHTGPDKIKLV